jgi:hypothetical protein
VDQLRGLVMMLMALDHTRDYFSRLSFSPEDLKLRLLDRIVQSRTSPQPDSSLPDETTELHKKIICQAVEDRICKRLDLETRPDLTDQQANDAPLPPSEDCSKQWFACPFFDPEIALLTRGTRSGCSAARR